MKKIFLFSIFFFLCSNSLIQSMNHTPIEKMTPQRKKRLSELISIIVLREDLDEIEKSLERCTIYKERCLRYEDKKFQNNLIEKLLEKKLKLSSSIVLNIEEVNIQEENFKEQSATASELSSEKRPELFIEKLSYSSEETLLQPKNLTREAEIHNLNLEQTSKWCSIS